MDEGELEPNATTDGGPYAAGGWNDGCHGVAWRAPGDGWCLGVGGSRGNAPNPDGGWPTEPTFDASKGFDGRGGTRTECND